MKKIILSLFVLILFAISSQSFAQTNYGGFMEELYIGRQPSPRAEAMGRGLAADNQNDFGQFYNPALTSLTEGLKINTSFSNKYFYYDKAFFNYFGASYKVKNIGSFAASRYYYNIGFDIDETTLFQPLGTGSTYRIHYDIYSINYSREIIKDLYGGLNIGFASHHNGSSFIAIDKASALTLDLGLLKKFTLPALANKNLSQSISIGTSVTNITNSKFVFTYSDVPLEGSSNAYLPVIFRGAASYNFNVKKNSPAKNSNLISFLAHFEYEKVLNTARYETYKVGSEVTIADIVSVRAGHFSRKSNPTSSIFGFNTGEFSQFTYGAGVKIPLSAIFNMSAPLSLSIDYVSLKQPTALRQISLTSTENFNTVSVNLNYVPGW